MDKKGLIHYGKNKPYKKVYLHESKGKPIQNLWSDIPNITRTVKDRREYPTQKPIKLLHRIIHSSCPKNGIIIDPFMGSGTTMRAADILNKEKGYNLSTINMDLNEECFKIIKEDFTDVVPKVIFGNNLSDLDILQKKEEIKKQEALKKKSKDKKK